MEQSSAFKLDERLAGIGRGDFPQLYRVRQTFPRTVEKDLPAAVRREIAPFLGQVKPGQQIAITGSSRGIANLASVIREAAKSLKEAGAQPFVVPGMGSHGGATAPGQIEMLEANGITEASVGCPIRASMDVIQIGTTATGFPVYFDRIASEADGVLVVNRVKPHTGFTEKVESGICKMLVIGLGKQAGASKIHQQALKVPMGTMVLQASKMIVESPEVKFLGALALVDNAYKDTAVVKGIPLTRHDGLVAVESGLLKQAYDLLPRIPYDDLDVLIVDEIGKNVSGSGMDTNVIGRKEGMTRPRIGGIYVRGLTPESHGNATGMGNADVMPRRLLPEIDLHSTYMNVYTAKVLRGAKMPLLVEHDLQALQVVASVRAEADPQTARIAWIRNTSKLTEFWISAALLEESRANNRLEVLSGPHPFQFDPQGALVEPAAEARH